MDYTIKFENEDQFRECFEAILKEYERHLLSQFSERTVRKHTVIISLLIDYLCFDCGVSNFDEITVGMVNSQFRKWHTSKIQDALESELKTAVKKFFNFLAQEKGIKNEKILNSFKK
jgi:hypothetical protein